MYELDILNECSLNFSYVLNRRYIADTQIEKEQKDCFFD